MDECNPDVRREALIADLERLATGWTPDATTLATAPRIEEWAVIYYPRSHDLALQGIVVGHPHLPDGKIITSPVMAIGLSNQPDCPHD